MGIRQKLNQNSTFATGGAAAVIVLALIVAIWQLWPHRAREPKRAYFTIDEGKSYFADDIGRIPPFDKDGKQACSAQVVRCGWGKPFVAFMERFTPQGLERLQKVDTRHTSAGDIARGGGAEIKTPGTSEWINWMDPRSAQVTTIKCPDGKTSPMPVWP